MTEKARKLYAKLMGAFKPPQKKSVVEWAEENMVLTSKTAAEPGPWRAAKTPYIVPIMNAFNEPGTDTIYVMAGAQVGKSEFLNNCLGYVVDVDPGPALWVFPAETDAKKYSKERISTMIAAVPALRAKVSPENSRNRDNTLLNKSFLGGSLALVGTNAPAGLRSRPIRYFFGDEVDAWQDSAGTEGSPEKLAERRTETFFNRKIVLVSTPTIRGRSKIEDGYLSGTQEEWQLPCPNCGQYHYIEFKHIVFDSEKRKQGTKTQYEVHDVRWRCPDCAFTFTEREMKAQSGMMVPQNAHPKQGVRSFRLNAFVSPWKSWDSIVAEFLDSKDDPLKLQVVYNTLFGECFEDRGDIEDADDMMERREDYGAELPAGVLVLTCGVDTQDDRLEYEVLGHGHHGETWGIYYGVIPGDPEMPETWAQLDAVLDKAWYFADGKGLRISMTFVDSGGHRTAHVYEACRQRYAKHVFAIKGMNRDDAPHVGRPKRIEYLAPNSKQQRQKCWYYPIGSSAGKSHIMAALRVQEPGKPKYCHFSKEAQGYTSSYFDGLLSETLVMKRVQGKNKQVWELLPGRRRNEPLDVRNYALAAFSSLVVDLHEVENKLKGLSPPKSGARQPARTAAARRRQEDNEW